MPVIENLGSVGIITDRPDFSLPPEAWSAGQNVRMNEGSVEKFLGHSQVFGAPTVDPYFLLPVQTTTEFYWLYASLLKVYVTDGILHTDITRTVGGDYSATADKNWTGVIFGGVPVLNNGFDEPQMWTPIGTGTKLQALTAWPASTTCNSLRSFKNFLVAMDVTKSGTRYPRLVKWSHSASFNSVPSSWDETDATKDAGEYELADTRGDVIDGLQLNDSFIIYKEDSIWGMQFVGAPLVFRFYKITDQVGIFSKRCVAEWEGGHFAFGHNDCIVTDGQSVRSVMDKRIRREVYDNIDPDSYSSVFVVANRLRREVWVCYPTTGSSYCDKAAVWNWAEDTFGFRDLPDVSDAGYGIIQDGGATDWDSDAGTWSSDSTIWDQRNFNPTQNSLVFASPSNSKMYAVDETNQEAGANMTAYVQRTGLLLGAPDRVKWLTGVIPNMDASGPVEFYFAGQMSSKETPVWDGPYSFDPANQHRVDCRVSHRYLGVKVQSDTDIGWKLSGMEMEMVDSGAN